MAAPLTSLDSWLKRLPHAERVWIVALHEAAHAVAAHLLFDDGFEVVELYDGYKGKCFLREGNHRTVDLLTFWLAGPTAEHTYLRGKYGITLTTVFEEAAEAEPDGDFGFICCNSRPEEWPRLRRRTKKFVEENWPMIRRAARALRDKGQLRYYEFKEVLGAQTNHSIQAAVAKRLADPSQSS